MTKLLNILEAILFAADGPLTIEQISFGVPDASADEIRASLVRQLLNPVLWEPTVRALAGLAANAYLEIGPGQVLRGLLRATDRSLSCRTMGTAEEVLAFDQDH